MDHGKKFSLIFVKDPASIFVFLVFWQKLLLMNREMQIAIFLYKPKSDPLEDRIVGIQFNSFKQRFVKNTEVKGICAQEVMCMRVSGLCLVKFHHLDPGRDTTSSQRPSSFILPTLPRCFPKYCFGLFPSPPEQMLKAFKAA